DVWSYYTGSISTTPIAPSTMISAIATAFGGVPGGPGESGVIYNNINGFFSTNGFPINGTKPQAFIQYIVYDKNYVMKFWGSLCVSKPNTKEHLVFNQITIDQPGYIYVNVYNRS